MWHGFGHAKCRSETSEIKFKNVFIFNYYALYLKHNYYMAYHVENLHVISFSFV